MLLYPENEQYLQNQIAKPVNETEMATNISRSLSLFYGKGWFLKILNSTITAAFGLCLFIYSFDFILGYIEDGIKFETLFENSMGDMILLSPFLLFVLVGFSALYHSARTLMSDSIVNKVLAKTIANRIILSGKVLSVAKYGHEQKISYEFYSPKNKKLTHYFFSQKKIIKAGDELIILFYNDWSSVLL